ncbi:hypothetical protein [Clostridium sp. D33t1_170424_F3]|uniref:hypothetical protein n=1 Tax=Clostridium sp. D33t1_170424_F3 TaxID=2787099 RepID=UPI0018A94C09|nr:hypothetical protein [Clostridium sp. D33t1_170424_F3]
MGQKGFTATVFIDRGEKTTKLASYSFLREPSSQGVYCYRMETREETTCEGDRVKINQKMAEHLKPVLCQLKEDALWKEK